MTSALLMVDLRRLPELDVLYPYAEECAFCGFPDKRHRMADAIVGCVNAGDSVEQTAYAYDVPVATVEALVATWNPNQCNWPVDLGRRCSRKPTHRGKHRP